MIGVKVKENESVDRAINRFKKMVTRSRVLMEYRERQQFTKPSEERREALKKSVREERRRQRFNYWFLQLFVDTRGELLIVDSRNSSMIKKIC